MNEADRLQRLEDCEAIRNLIASYGPLADSGNATALSELWTHDGIYAVGGFGEACGRQAIADLILAEFHQGLMAQGCAHILSPHHVDLNGDQANASGHSIVLRKKGDAFESWRVSANRWRLVRTDDGWKVALRENAPLDGSKAAQALLTLGHGHHLAKD